MLHLYAKRHWFWCNNNWVMLSFVCHKHTHPTCDVTSCAESAIYTLQIFANNFATKRDSVVQLTANRLIFSCSFKWNNNFIAKILLPISFNFVHAQTVHFVNNLIYVHFWEMTMKMGCLLSIQARSNAFWSARQSNQNITIHKINH